MIKDVNDATMFLGWTNDPTWEHAELLTAGTSKHIESLYNGSNKSSTLKNICDFLYQYRRILRADYGMTMIFGKNCFQVSTLCSSQYK